MAQEPAQTTSQRPNIAPRKFQDDLEISIFRKTIDQQIDFFDAISSISDNLVVIFEFSAKFRSGRLGQKSTGQVFEKYLFLLILIIYF